MWSVLTGIPVIGLKNAGGYYRLNKHMAKYLCHGDEHNGRPQGKVKIALTSSDVYVCEKNGATSEKFSAPWDLRLSCVWYRMRSAPRSYVHTMKESPAFAFEFFRDELVPLSELDTAWLTSIVRVLLRCNFGVIKLLQSTALYLSQAYGKSRLIVSPCTVEYGDYFGMQDGIMLERGGDPAQTLSSLLGKQLHQRAFNERPILKNFRTVAYSPHYKLTCDKELKDAENFVPRYQRVLLRGERDPAILDVLNALDDEQLQITLLTDGALRDLVRNTTVHFEPSGEINLSAFVYDKKRLVPIGSEQEEVKEFSWAVAQHLRTSSYQVLKKLIMQGCCLESDNIADIAILCNKNALPLLEVVDFSRNRIDDIGLQALKKLLERDSFAYLSLADNPLSLANGKPAIDNSLIHKVIWLSRGLLSRLESNSVDDDSIRAHNKFYRICP